MTITHNSVFDDAVGARYPLNIPTNTVGGAGTVYARFYSYWDVTKKPGAIGGVACTGSTPGALYARSTEAGKTRRLVEVQMAGSFCNRTAGTQVGVYAHASTLFIRDRLVHTDSLLLSTSSVYTLNTAALPRYTNGVGVQAFLCCWATCTGTNSTVTNLTVVYINQAGASRTVTFPVNAGTLDVVNVFALRNYLPIPLLAGDTGVRQIVSVQSDAPAWMTAGEVGIVLSKLVAIVPVSSSRFKRYGPMELGLPEIADNACLEAVGTAGFNNYWVTPFGEVRAPYITP